MISTSKYTCRAIAWLVEQYGAKDVVLSPGSRVAPLTVAMVARSGLRCHAVADERRAAFEALGMALISQSPVVLCCTSGSAMLNYAPAVAEAYYRGVPLIVITADRPAYIIGQDDGQTIMQPHTFDNIVKMSKDIDAEADDDVSRAAAVRDVNEALDAAMTPQAGPVHINVHIGEPLNELANVCDDEQFRKIMVIRPLRDMPADGADALGRELAPPRKVAVICGFMPPDERMSGALAKLASLSGISVWAEILSNVNVPGAVTNIDDVIERIAADDTLRPDVAIVCGGSLVSKKLKHYLRSNPGIKIWRVGEDNRLIDTFHHLDKRIDMPAWLLFKSLATAMKARAGSSDYGQTVYALSQQVRAQVDGLCRGRGPLTQLRAMSIICRQISERVNLQLSNGMTIRYACRFGPHARRVDCNRGVSGIDGSTSTAVGAARAYSEGLTLLLTGDMSAYYDIAPLLGDDLPQTFRAIIFCNRGGDIFRRISSTRELPVVEKYLAMGSGISCRAFTSLTGAAVFEADSEDRLYRLLPDFFAARTAAVMVVKL